MTTPAPFDPARHLTLVSGKEYLEVKWRLVWLRSEHPDALVETEMVEHQLGKFASFKAKVSVPGGGTATGWGSEDPQGFRDYFEKAETKAVGRALAALGYGTQFCADFDFGAAAGRVVDAPVEFRAIGGAPAQQAPRPQQQAPRQQQAAPSGEWTSKYPPSAAQIGLITKLIADRNLSPDDANRLAEEVSNGYSKIVQAMSGKDASKFIDALMNGTPSAPPSSGYANSSRQEANQSRGNMQDEATANQKGLISKLWLERGGSDEPGSKHTYVRDVMGIEWEDMTKQDATDFIGQLKNPEWTPF